MVSLDLDTLVLPVVEVGNLGKEHLDKIYYVKKDDESLSLYPLLSLKTSLREMYAGNSEYAHRLFYLASALPEEVVSKHYNFALPLKNTPEYIKQHRVSRIQTNSI